jgi:hypothetical protein
MKKKKYSKQPGVGRLVRVVAEKEMGFDAFFFSLLSHSAGDTIWRSFHGHPTRKPFL